MPEHSSRPVLRDPEFLKLWIGQSISLLGSQISFLAIPLTAAVLLDAGPLEFGILAGLGGLPFLLMSLPAGVWIDRLPRRRILIVADLVRGAALLTIPLTFAAGQLSMSVLYAVAVVNGVATVFSDAAHLAYLPSLMPRDQLVEGNSRLQLSRSIATISGPGLGGALVAALSAPVAVVVDALSYFVSAGMIALIRKAEFAPEHRRRPMLAEIFDGLRFILAEPHLRAMAGNTATWNLFTQAGSSLLILFATKELLLGAVPLGVIFAVANTGVLLGAVAGHRLVGVLGFGNALVGAVLVAALSGLLIPIATPTTGFALLVTSGWVRSFCAVVYNVQQISLRQAITPHELQGRMNASFRLLVWGTGPLGAFLGGLLASVIGLRTTILLAMVLAGTSLVWLLASPVARLREAPKPRVAEA